MVWCHLWPHQGSSTCAKLHGFWLVSFYLPCGSYDHSLFLIDSDWSREVIWPKQIAMAIFNWIVFIRWYFMLRIYIYCDYSYWKLFEKLFWGSKCPISIENGSARGGWLIFWPHHWIFLFLVCWFDVSHAYVILRIWPWKMQEKSYDFSWIGSLKTSLLRPLASSCDEYFLRNQGKHHYRENGYQIS